jgi:TetR/AcrR family transcriptional regulator, lmrAB and yxaGH operons repressor
VTNDARDRMVDAAIVLLARGGYPAASFSAVLAESGAPRGSIYHHFPGGKDELVAAAVERQAGRVVAHLGSLAGRPPAEVVDEFAALWRALLVRADFSAGCSLLAVAVAAEPPALRDESGVLFGRWRDALTALFAAGGVDADEASGFALELLAATEGAVAIARAQRSLDPFERVVARLRREAEALR